VSATSSFPADASGDAAYAMRSISASLGPASAPTRILTTLWAPTFDLPITRLLRQGIQVVHDARQAQRPFLYGSYSLDSRVRRNPLAPVHGTASATRGIAHGT